MGNSKSSRWQVSTSDKERNEKRAALKQLAENAGSELVALLALDAKSEVEAALGKIAQQFDEPDMIGMLVGRLTEMIDDSESNTEARFVCTALAMVARKFRTKCPQMLFAAVLSSLAGLITRAITSPKNDEAERLEVDCGVETTQYQVVRRACDCVMETCFRTEWMQVVRTRILPRARLAKEMGHFDIMVSKFLPALILSLRQGITSLPSCSVETIKAILNALGGCLYHIHEFHGTFATLENFVTKYEGVALLLKVATAVPNSEVFIQCVSLLSLCEQEGFQRVYNEQVAEDLIVVLRKVLNASEHSSIQKVIKDSAGDDISLPSSCSGADLEITVQMSPRRPPIPSSGKRILDTFVVYLSWCPEKVKANACSKLVSYFVSGDADLKDAVVTALVGLEQNIDSLVLSCPEFLFTTDSFWSQQQVINLCNKNTRLLLFLEALKDGDNLHSRSAALLCKVLLDDPPLRLKHGNELLQLSQMILNQNHHWDWLQLCCSLAVIDSCLQHLAAFDLHDDSFRVMVLGVSKLAFLNDPRFRDACASILCNLLKRANNNKDILEIFFTEVRSTLGNMYGPDSSLNSTVAIRPSCAVFLDGLSRLDDVPTLEFLWSEMNLSTEMLHFVDAYAQRMFRHETALSVLSTICTMFARCERIKATAKRRRYFCEYGSLLASCCESRDQLVQSICLLFSMLFDGSRSFQFEESRGFFDGSSSPSVSRVATNPDILDTILVFLSEMPQRDSLLLNATLGTIVWLVKPFILSPLKIEQEIKTEGNLPDNPGSTVDHRLLFCLQENDFRFMSESNAEDSFNEIPYLVQLEEGRMNATAFSQTQQSIILQLLANLENLDSIGQLLCFQIIVAIGLCQTTVRQVKSIFRKIWYLSSKNQPELCVMLVKCINSVLDEDKSYIYFDGIHSGLSVLVENGVVGGQQDESCKWASLRSQNMRWPSVEALSFSAWVKLYDPLDSSKEPFIIFEFLNDSLTYGLSLSVDSDGTLVVCSKVDNRETSYRSTANLNRTVWYHVGAIFCRQRSTGFLHSTSKDIVVLYLNGQQVDQFPLDFPFYRKRYTKIGSWSIGIDYNESKRFHGCMRQIKFWIDAIEAVHMNEIYHGYERKALDGSLALRLDESAVTGSLGTFLDISPSPKRYFKAMRFVAISHADRGTRACWRRGALKSMIAVGGMNAVVPLLALECSGELSGCSLYLLGKLISTGQALHRSRRFIRDGISVLSYLLSRLSPGCIDRTTLQGAFFFVQKLESDWLLFQQAVREILLNLRIWSNKADGNNDDYLSKNAVVLASLLCTQPIRARRVVGFVTLVNEVYCRSQPLSFATTTQVHDQKTSQSHQLDQGTASTIIGAFNPEGISAEEPNHQIELESDLEVLTIGKNTEAFRFNSASPIRLRDVGYSVRQALRKIWSRSGNLQRQSNPSVYTQEKLILLMQDIVTTTKQQKLEVEEHAAVRALMLNCDIDGQKISKMILQIVLDLMQLDPTGLVKCFTIEVDSSDTSMEKINSPTSAENISSAVADDAQSISSSVFSKQSVACIAEVLIFFLASDHTETVLEAVHAIVMLHSRQMIQPVARSIWSFIGVVLFHSLKELPWEGSEVAKLMEGCFKLATIQKPGQSVQILTSGDALATFLLGPLKATPCGERKQDALRCFVSLLKVQPLANCHSFNRVHGWQEMLLQSLCDSEGGCACFHLYLSIFDLVLSYDLFRHALDIAKRPDRRKGQIGKGNELALEKTLDWLSQQEKFPFWLGPVLLVRALFGSAQSLERLRESQLLTVGHEAGRLIARLTSVYAPRFVGTPNLPSHILTYLDETFLDVLDFAKLMNEIYPAGSDHEWTPENRNLRCVTTDVDCSNASCPALTSISLQPWLRSYTGLKTIFETLLACPLHREAESSSSNDGKDICRCRICLLRIDASRYLLTYLISCINESTAMCERILVSSEDEDQLSAWTSAIKYMEGEIIQLLTAMSAQVGLIMSQGLRIRLEELVELLTAIPQLCRELSGMQNIVALVSSMQGTQDDPGTGERSPDGPKYVGAGPIPINIARNMSITSTSSITSGGSYFTTDSQPTLTHEQIVVRQWLSIVSHVFDSWAKEEYGERSEIANFREVAERLAEMKWKGVLKQVTHERGTWGEGKGIESVFWKIDHCECSPGRARPRIRVNIHGTKHKEASTRMREATKSTIVCKGEGRMENFPSEESEEEVASSRATKMNLYNELCLARAFGANFFTRAPETFIVSQSGRIQTLDRTTSQLHLPSPSLQDLTGVQSTSSSSQELDSGVSGSSSLGTRQRRSPSHQAVLTRQHVQALAQQHRKQASKSPDSLFLENVKLITHNGEVEGILEISKVHVKFLRQQSETRSDGTVGIGKRWLFRSVRKVYKRRYRMNWQAVELFTGLSEQKSYFFVFESSFKCEMALRLVAKVIKQEDALWTPEERCRKSGAQEAWVQGEMSNFEYLMLLNECAGRSYNDLAQYPIMPWILKDYSSAELDLDNADIYRDLRYPIGAQSEKKQEELAFKFAETQKNHVSANNGGTTPGGILSGQGLFRWPFPVVFGKGRGQDEEKYGDEHVLMGPPWHFGSFYSSRAVVLWYMVRLEPFTTLHIDLQGNKFDLADRQFHSIEGAFQFATDLTPRELIPEMFCNAEILRNSAGFDLGTKQDGTVLNDVILPPWACGSPERFINLHRLALESDYVSENLHHWIDLTFGYKQRGMEAEEAMNVYFHLMYEGAVDLEYLEEVRPDLYNTVLRMVDEYGQCPPVLFSKPHPARQGKNKRVRKGSVLSHSRNNSSSLFSDCGSALPPLALATRRPSKVLDPSKLVQARYVFMNDVDFGQLGRGILWLSPHIQTKVAGTGSFGELIEMGGKKENEDGSVGLGCFLAVTAERNIKFIQLFSRVNGESFDASVGHLAELGAPFAFSAGVGQHMFAFRIDQAKDFIGSGQNFSKTVGKLKYERLGGIFSPVDPGLEVPELHNLVSIYGTGFWDSSFRSIHLEVDSRSVMSPESFVATCKPDANKPRRILSNSSPKFVLQLEGALSRKSRVAGPSTGALCRRYVEDGLYKEHSDTTTCVAITEDGTRVLTGSVDCCVCVWRVNGVYRPAKVSGKGGFVPSTGEGLDYSTNSLEGKAGPMGTSKSNGLKFQQQLKLEMVLLGHDDVVTSIAVCASLDLVVSASLDGTCILHTLDTGTYLRSVAVQSSIPKLSISSGFQGSYSSNQSSGWSWVGISNHRFPLFNAWCEDDLKLYSVSINGRVMNERRCNSPMFAFQYSSDSSFLACCTKNRVVYVFDSFSLVLVCQSQQLVGDITSISCLKDSTTFLVGLSDGSLAVISLEG